MPNYRLTLMENLPNRAPAALDVEYTYDNGQRPSTWRVTAIGPDTDRAVVVVNSPVNLSNVPNVKTRKLIGHYPVDPITREFVISSVQPPAVAHDSAELLAATPYNVSITMSQNTVEALNAGNFSLFGFKGVKTTMPGKPLVWFQSDDFGLSTEVEWEEQYEAYTSRSELIVGGKIVASNSYPIGLDNTLNVTGTSGTGSVDTSKGVPDAIAISNLTTTQFVCGISQNQGGASATPLCAFPLYGGNLCVIAPIELVLLTFSSIPVNTGTVIEQAYSPGLLVDLTGENSREVSFDINLGWSWGGGIWAQKVAPQEELVPLLIQGSPALARRQLASI